MIVYSGLSQRTDPHINTLPPGRLGLVAEVGNISLSLPLLVASQDLAGLGCFSARGGTASSPDYVSRR